MILTKPELLSALRHEVDILLHLISKIDPAKLDYRPTPKQRGTIELLRYLAIMGPIHFRAILGDAFDVEAWKAAWTTGVAASNLMTLDQTRDAIAAQPALYAELLDACPDSRLRGDFELFGNKASRGAILVNLVLCHYVAYRMQLFLYLKSSGREELGTMNLWGGRDPA